jgi:hypothetical protein
MKWARQDVLFYGWLDTCLTANSAFGVESLQVHDVLCVVSTAVHKGLAAQRKQGLVLKNVWQWPCALHSRSASASESAFNVSSTLPRTTRSSRLLIRSSSIVMTLLNGLGVFSVMAAPSCCPGCFQPTANKVLVMRSRERKILSDVISNVDREREPTFGARRNE